MRPALDARSQLCIFVTLMFSEFYFILACQIYQTPFIYCVKSIVKKNEFELNAFLTETKITLVKNMQLFNHFPFVKI